MNETAPAIEVVDLTRHYRRGPDLVRALDGVSLSVSPGEFLSVVGRSGSGKTTLLDCMGLLMRPTSGRVLLDGVETSQLNDRRRAEQRGLRIGFVFQEFNLLPGLTALENVALPLRYTGRLNDEGRQRATDLLEQVGLADRRSHRPAQMSGGEQQRVAIARALVNRPALVLGDEPTGEVDSETSGILLSLMRTMNREHGVTFVLVTHDLDLAASTDRMVRLQDGRIVSDQPVPRTSAQA